MKLKNVVLYCKGHYQRSGDVWADLKKCLEADDYAPETNSDVLGIMGARAAKLVLSQYSSPETALIEMLSDIAPWNTWKVGYYHKDSPKFIWANVDSKIEELPEYDYREAVLRAYMSRVSMSTREDLEWSEAPIPDPNVLPLKREPVNEQL